MYTFIHTYLCTEHENIAKQCNSGKKKKMRLYYSYTLCVYVTTTYRKAIEILETLVYCFTLHLICLVCILTLF